MNLKLAKLNFNLEWRGTFEKTIRPISAYIIYILNASSYLACPSATLSLKILAALRLITQIHYIPTHTASREKEEKGRFHSTKSVSDGGGCARTASFALSAVGHPWRRKHYYCYLPASTWRHPSLPTDGAQGLILVAIRHYLPPSHKSQPATRWSCSVC